MENSTITKLDRDQFLGILNTAAQMYKANGQITVVDDTLDLEEKEELPSSESSRRAVLLPSIFYLPDVTSSILPKYLFFLNFFRFRIITNPENKR